MVSIKVFVKDGCSRCPAAKDLAGKLKNEGYEVHEFQMETAEGLAESVYYGVLSTPTMMLVDREDNPVTAWRGTVPAVDEIRGAMAAF
jgi:hypothetical protein